MAPTSCMHPPHLLFLQALMQQRAAGLARPPPHSKGGGLRPDRAQGKLFLSHRCLGALQSQECIGWGCGVRPHRAQGKCRCLFQSTDRRMEALEQLWQCQRAEFEATASAPHLLQVSTVRSAAAGITAETMLPWAAGISLVNFCCFCLTCQTLAGFYGPLGSRWYHRRHDAAVGSA